MGPRDRFIDLLRGASIVAVVLGHWLVADLRWSDDAAAVTQTSALREVPGMWPLTWLLTVIPLFFFVGGYANRLSWNGTRRRGEGYAAFVDRRVHRVLVPSGLYVTVIALLGLLADRLGGLGIRAMGGILLQPLWFLGAYLCVVALTPITLAAHRRFGWRFLVVGGLVVALCDIARFAGGIAAAGYVNVLLVWLLVHQVGYWYPGPDGDPGGMLDRRVAAGMVLGGLATAALLVGAGPYTSSMVGVTGGPVGNMHPPTAAILAVGVAQIGAALLLRPWLLRWLQRPRAWMAVVWVNLHVVSIYVWHQAALAATARLGLPVAGLDPQPGSAAWWAWRLLWLAVPGALLVAVVMVVGRAERVTAPQLIAPGRVTASMAALGVVLVGLGFLALAGSSATEPLAWGQALGPLRASLLLGLVLLGASAAIFAVLRRVRPAGAEAAARPSG